ncbi:FG-GAP repeat protein [Rosistilla oblonga]|uniref:GEVED domain-containing protein n=1 Tax=Rosistilla oblonga TaxID=2527990 RepID=UPI001189B97E|nr:GEVED domain-containing protein [Rosistilla oblonga]QDV14718.1 FG-GAP repeat protein [Rosistilla oblonga]
MTFSPIRQFDRFVATSKSRRSLAKRRKNSLQRRKRRSIVERLEDRHLLAIDFGDAPDLGVGTGVGDYQTLLADNGPSHEVSSRLFMGAIPDSEADAQPNEQAAGDDDRTGPRDDEDGLRNPTLDLAVTVTSSPTVNVFVTNTTGQPATLYGWIDFNGDGVFDNATERASADVGFAISESVPLQFPEIQPGFHGRTYARFRLGLDADTAAQNPTGAAGIGEIEDYQAQVTIPTRIESSPLRLSTEISSGLLADNDFGSSMVTIGDLDENDAIDLAVGAPGDDTGGNDRGAVHLLYRDEFGAVLKTDYLASGMSGLHELNDFDLFGASVSATGDLDGNGVTDLLVGAPGDDTAGADSGAAYLLFLDVVDGRTVIEKSVVYASGMNGVPELDDQGRFGSTVAAVGDINRDGIGDFAIAQKQSLGAVHLLFMNADGTVQETRLLQSGTDVIPARNEWGKSVVGLGDVDGDGIPDLAVGAVSSADILILNADGTVRSSNRLGESDYVFGDSLTALGDVDGDKVPDLAVGASRRTHVYLLNTDGMIAHQTSTNFFDGIVHSVASTAIPLQDDATELISFQDGKLISSRLTEAIYNDEGQDHIDDFTESFIFDTLCPACEDRALAYIGKVDASGMPVAEDATLANIAVGVPGYGGFGFDSGGVQTIIRFQRGAQTAKLIASNTGGMGPLAPNDRFGAALAEAGDLDGDGYTDLFVSAPGDSFSRGAIYVLYLNSESLVKNYVKLDIDTNGISFSQLGGSIDVVGDMNGDGIDDLVVSSLTADRTRHQVQLLLMNEDLTGGRLQRIASPPGTEPSWGTEVVGLGDIDGDSVPDLAVSGPQSSRVDLLFMNQSPLAGSTAGFKSFTQIPNDGESLFGASLASMGDMDGDGIAELAVGAMNRAFVFFLESDGTVERSTGIIRDSLYDDVDIPMSSLAALPGHTGDNFVYLAAASETIRIDGLVRSLPTTTQSFNQAVRPIDNQEYAHSLTTVGDLDGNGVTDIVLGSPEMGALHVLFMGAGTLPYSNNGRVERVTEISSEVVSYPYARTILRGGLTEPIPGLGSSVANIGDLDGDGITDLLVGGDNAHVLFLNTDGTVRTTASIDVGDEVAAVTGLGDIDGDGVVDIALGTPSRNVGTEAPAYSWGGVHILLMNPDGSVKSQQIVDKYTPGLQGADGLLAFGASLTVVGDINGDGVPDLAVAESDQSNRDLSDVHVLLLDRNGSMIVDQVIQESRIGTTVSLEDAVLVPAGDLDGDAVPDLRIYTRSTKRIVLFNSDGTVKVQSIKDAGDDSTVYDFSATPLPDLNNDGVNEILVGTLVRAYGYGRRELVIDYPRPEFTLIGDLGDAPDVGKGTAAWDYNTFLTDDGPRHGMSEGLYLGESVSIDELPSLSTAADSDDDDGVVDPVRDLHITGVPTIELLVTNESGVDAKLYGWIDTNFDGSFDESERVSTDVIPYGINQSVTLVFPELPLGLAGVTYARFRLSTDEAAALPTGVASDGEVEDYLVTIETPSAPAQTMFDYGDAAIGNSGSIVSTATTPQPQLVVGAFHNIGDIDGNGTTDLAVSVLIGGNSPGVEIHLMNPDGTVKRVESTAIPVDLQTHRLGESFTGSGDLNGDGIPDVVIGSTGIGSEAAGRLDVVFLGRDGKSIGSAIIGGDSGNGPPLSELAGFGISVASIGDIDADGHDDLAVGAAGFEGDGRVFILLMGADGVVDDYEVITGPGDFGSSVVNLGDLNGDLVTDLLVGAPTYSDALANRRSGAAFVVFMNDDGTEQGRNIISQSTGIGISADDRFGASVASLGDVSGDEIIDIAVGSPYDNTGGMNRGAVYVLQLATDGSVTDISKIATGMGGGPEDSADNHGSFGQSIAVMDDNNSNDLPELLVRASSSDYRVELASASSVMHSPSHGLDSNIFLGSFVDAEIAPNPNDAATGDDVTGFGNDEDGLVNPSQLRNLAVGQNPSVDLYVTNLTGSDATLYGWIDYDMNGEFDEGEQVSLSVPSEAVGKGSLGEIVTLTFPEVPEGFSGTTYARFRFSTDASAAVPTGHALDGEVEDYVVTGLGNGYQNLIPAGSLDPGFGDGGVVSSEIRQPTGDTGGYVVAYPSNGQSLVLGNASGDVTVMRLNADGGVDGSFGNLGVAKYRMWFDGARMSASSMALDDRGRIIIVGSLSFTDGSGRSEFAITRLTPNGHIDTSFGIDGFQFIDFAERKTGGPDIAIDSQGRIVVGGSAQHIDDRDYDFAVARLTTDGVLDSDFSDDGKHHFDIGGTTDISTSLTIDPQDRIVMGGYTNVHSGIQNDLAVVRLTTDGVLDESFDSDGIQTIDFNHKSDLPGSVAIDSLGRIVVTGRSIQGGETGTDTAVARLTADGALDTTFSDDGKQLIDLFSQQELTTGLVIDSSDRILVGGYTRLVETNDDLAVLRLTTTGELDTTFDEDGIQLIDFNKMRDYGGQLAIDPQGNILVGGTVQNGTSSSDIGVARLTPSGDFDRTFSRDGKLTTDIGSPASSYSSASEIVAYQPDGKMVVVGNYNGAIVLARHFDDGTVDLTFGDRGVATVDPNPFSSSGSPIGVHVDAQGRGLFVTQGRQESSNSGTLEDIHIYRLTSDGELDVSFGTDGLRVIDFDSQRDNPSDFAVDSQGRILLVGISGSNRFLIRLTPDGLIDPTFDTSDSSGLSYPTSYIAIDENDNVVLVGRASNDITAARFLESGRLDRNFGDDGIQRINLVDGSQDSNDFATGVAMDKSGRVVVTGYYYNPSSSSYHLAILWLNPDGSLDVSYDDDGKVSFDFGSDNERVYSQSVDSSSRVVVGGYTTVAGVSTFAVARFNPNGTFDKSFGVEGKKVLEGTAGTIKSVFVDEFDRILMADSNFAILRLLSNDGAGGEYLASLLTKDFGDAPDLGTNTTGSYNTLSINQGPTHVVSPSIFMGAGVTVELDAIPVESANSDTDDGVVAVSRDLILSLGQVPIVTVQVTNDTEVDAWMYGWIDYNADGVFDPETEQATSVSVNGTTADEQLVIPAGFKGNAVLAFPSVPITSAESTYARFRLSTDAAVANPTGPAADGEVEDYQVTILTKDFGDAPDRYGTRVADGGPSHRYAPGLSIGSTIDLESDGYASNGAIGDDSVGETTDEDGILNPNVQLDVTPGVAPSVSVLVTNDTGLPARLYGWIDVDLSGTFDSHERRWVDVPDGKNAAQGDFVTLPDFPAIAEGKFGQTYARFRLSTDFGDAVDDLGIALPIGYAVDGEVEDYLVTFLNQDFGDAPDSYKTSETSGGPSHQIDANLLLGDRIDSERDGLPTVSANGDDQSASIDDEDGLLDAASDLKLVVGETPKVRIVATNLTGRMAAVHGWIDFNGDGDFLDAGEHQYKSIASGAINAQVDLIFPQIDAEFFGTTYARFRLTTDFVEPHAVAPTGRLIDGEVEDYVATISMPLDPTTLSPQEFSIDTQYSLMLGSQNIDTLGFDSLSTNYGASVSAFPKIDDEFSIFVIGVPGPVVDSGSDVVESVVGNGGQFRLIYRDANDNYHHTLRWGWETEYLGERHATAIASLGDIGGDGTQEIAIGRTGTDLQVAEDGSWTRGNKGEVKILSRGDDGKWTGIAHLRSGNDGVPLLADHDQFGYAIANVGLIDNDDVPDLAVSAIGHGIGQGAVYILLMNEDGTAKDYTRLESGNGMMPELPAGTQFGRSVTSLGNGLIAVGASGNGTAESIYIMQLGSNGQLVSQPVQYAPASEQPSGFGDAVASPGDLNADGVADLLVGAPLYGARGAVYVLYLNSDHSVRGTDLLTTATTGMPSLQLGERFGSSIAVLTELGADGIVELAVGSPGYGDYDAGRVRPFLLKSKLTPDTLADAVAVLSDESKDIVTTAGNSNVSDWLQAVSELPAFPRPNDIVTITLNLEEAGIENKSYVGLTVTVPSGYQLVINGSNGPVTFQGASPALTVVSGDVFVLGDVTFTNATDAPTILVQGGSLTLRNSIIEETTTADRPAIHVTGGTVDLGTANDPGGNTIIIHGDGDLIENASPDPLSAIGNTFQIDDVPIVSKFEIEAEITDYLEQHDAGLVSYFANKVFDSLVAGTRDLDLLSLVADLELTDPTFVITEAVNGEAEILSDDHTVRFVAKELGSASFRYSVRVDDVEVATRIAHFDVTNLPPVVAVELAELTVDAGDVATNSGTIADSEGDTITLSASIGTIITSNDGSGTWTWSLDTNDVPDGSHTVTITATDSVGITSRTTFSLTVNPAAKPLAVTGVTVNDGAVQRSNTTELAIQFDRDFDAQALINTGQIMNSVSLHTGAGYSTDVALTADQFRWDAATSRLLIDLAAAGTQTRLADGRYELRIHSTIDSSFVDSDGTDDEIHRYQFHQLQGDFDGDAIVGISDRDTWFDSSKVRFGARLGMSSYDSTFDFDGDGILSTRDYYMWLRSCVGKQLN